MVGVVGIDLLGLALSCKLGGQAGLKLLVTEGQRLREAADKWGGAVATNEDKMMGPFPPTASDAGNELLSALLTIVKTLDDQGNLGEALTVAHGAEGHALKCEGMLADNIDARFGKGKANSVPFRQYQAEYECSFPAQHLDECREILTVLAELIAWLQSPAIRAAAERVLVLMGPAGIGKTHGLCDAGVRRREAGLATVLVSGAQFSSERTVWECLVAALGLDSSWSRDALLDALDATGSATGRLLVCIDALDECARRSRWQDDLPELVQVLVQRPNLALCVSVRDGYQRQVLREGLDLPIFEHPGFSDSVFDACAAFFQHFELEPPIGPLLEPEFSNPLFLRVLCETLKVRNLTAVPSGWRGTRQVLGHLLTARDKELQTLFPGVGNRAVSSAMEALADAAPEGGALRWSEADEIASNSLPRSQQAKVDLLERLVGLGLLRVVPGDDNDEWGTAEDRVDIAFGRLRHHLIADQLTSGSPGTPDDRLRIVALEDPGLAESLALILPERGRSELVDLASDPAERQTLMAAWLASLPWRDGDTLGDRVNALLMHALNEPDLRHKALDALITLALRPEHRYDHRFLHALLARIPMPRRDAVLCWYLHQAFERASPPSPVVRALRAPWEADPSRLPPVSG